MAQKLILDDQMEVLRQNGAVASRSGDGSDLRPVLKLFTPDGAATWLISEIDTDGDTLFGLCDLGLGEPELGYVSLTEIKSIRGGLGLPVERDISFTPTMTMAEYTTKARRAGRIVL
jgi:hypothetical protein